MRQARRRGPAGHAGACRCTRRTTSCATSWCRSTPGGRSPRCSTRPGATSRRPAAGCQHRVRADPRHQRPGLAGRPARHRAQPARPRLGARQPDPAQPDAGVEVDGAATREVERTFVARLRAHGVPTTVRDTRGREIDGACGQLAAVTRRDEPTAGSPGSAGCARATTAGRSTRSSTTSRCPSAASSRRRRRPRSAGRLRAGAPRLRRRRRSTSTSTRSRSGSSSRRAAGERRRGRADPASEAEFLAAELTAPYMKRFPRACILRRGYHVDDVDEFVDRVVGALDGAGRGHRSRTSGRCRSGPPRRLPRGRRRRGHGPGRRVPAARTAARRTDRHGRSHRRPARRLTPVDPGASPRRRGRGCPDGRLPGDLHAAASTTPTAFWADAARAVDWRTPADEGARRHATRRSTGGSPTAC